MSFWENIKNIIPTLVDIKPQLIRRNLFISGKHFHIENMSSELSSKIEQSTISPEMQDKYYQLLNQRISVLEEKYDILNESEMLRQAAITASSSAVQAITGVGEAELSIIRIKAYGTGTISTSEPTD
jgi:hypothetical protein